MKSVAQVFTSGKECVASNLENIEHLAVAFAYGFCFRLHDVRQQDDAGHVRVRLPVLHHVVADGVHGGPVRGAATRGCSEAAQLHDRPWEKLLHAVTLLRVTLSAGANGAHQHEHPHVLSHEAMHAIRNAFPWRRCPQEEPPEL